MNSLSEANSTLMDVQAKYDSTHAQSQTLQTTLDESIHSNKMLSEKLDKVNKQITKLESRVTHLQNEAEIKVSDYERNADFNLFFDSKSQNVFNRKL